MWSQPYVDPTQATFQDAVVRKPLAAVSGIKDKENIVLFDKKGSFISRANCPEVQYIRRLVHAPAFTLPIPFRPSSLPCLQSPPSTRTQHLTVKLQGKMNFELGEIVDPMSMDDFYR